MLSRVNSCSDSCGLLEQIDTTVAYTALSKPARSGWSAIYFCHNNTVGLLFLFIYLLAFIQSTTLFRAFPAGNEVVHRLYTIDGADSRTVYIVPN